MNERTPTLLLEAPQNLSELDVDTVAELPAPDDSGRYEADFAYDVAIEQDMQRNRINNARENVKRALAQNSPLVDKYRTDLANAELDFRVNAVETDKFYDRFYRQSAKTEVKPSEEELRLAA